MAWSGWEEPFVKLLGKNAQSSCFLTPLNIFRWESPSTPVWSESIISSIQAEHCYFQMLPKSQESSVHLTFQKKHWLIFFNINILISSNPFIFSYLIGLTVQYMEKAMAPHSSTLAWKIPWTEEPGRLQSMGSLRVRHNWATSLSLFTFMHWRRKWQPTPVFLPGESQGRGSLVGCRLWGRTESDTTQAT